MSEEKHVISTDASDFVVLSDVVPDMIQEIRYFSTYNFVGDRIEGYDQPVALMTKKAAAVVAKCAAIFKEMGYIIKVYDTYRPFRAVAHFCRWGEDLADQRMKYAFYPDVDKDKVFEEGFLDPWSGHSRGSTIDLTLVDMKTGLELDMGGTFDFFGGKSYSLYDGITEEQKKNRMILRNVMLDNGFRPARTEWWHFRLIDEPYTDTYFDFPNSEASVRK